MLRSVVLLLSLAAMSEAICPNMCSGHGSCGNDDICTCYQDWLSPDTVKANGGSGGGGGDCSHMKCPYEIAWVDTPSAENKAHALAECAGRGLCDRATGECQCFPGYTGKGCRRTTCPNDCSGHGTCEYLSELRNDLGDHFKWTGSLPTRDQFNFQFPLLWDAHKTRACVCDPKWTDVDCSRRMCPKGNYALYANTDPTPEVQAVIFTNVFTPGTDVEGDDEGYKYSNQGPEDQNGEFALTFRSTLNEEFTTKTLNVYNLTELSVEEALNSLPNKVIEEAEVTLYRNLSKYDNSTYGGQNKNWQKGFPYTAANNYTWYDTDLVVLISYSGSMTTGNQYALECRTAYCGAGCQPRLENALDFKVGSECRVVNDFTPAYAVNIECSGRGSCDYDSGICSCFEGYTDEFCSTQTALI
jgi:hypothetical protein